MYILICVIAFIISFVGSLVFKMTYTPAALREYSVSECSDEIGTVHTDIDYGNGEANKFDLYLPADNSQETYGLVVYLHAGGFRTGDKADDEGTLKWLTSLGYAAAGINYTLAKDKDKSINVYTQSQEIKESIPKVIEVAAELGYNIDRMAMAGGSAGGTLALLYAYRDKDESPVPVKMAFEAVGPTSFYTEDWTSYGFNQHPEAGVALFSYMTGNKITTDMIGTTAYNKAIKDTSALLWIDENTVPTVAIYGAHDTISPFLTALRFKDALEVNNVAHDFFIAEHSGHGLQNDNDVYAEYMKTVKEYLDKYISE